MLSILNNKPVEIKEFEPFMGPRENVQGVGKKSYSRAANGQGMKKLRLDIRGEGILYDPGFFTPQTGKFCPVMKFAFSHPGNAAMSAISLGFQTGRTPMILSCIPGLQRGVP
jgi:hypothetical protein